MIQMHAITNVLASFQNQSHKQYAIILHKILKIIMYSVNIIRNVHDLDHLGNGQVQYKDANL